MKKRGNPNFDRDRNKDTFAANSARSKTADEFARQINAVILKCESNNKTSNKMLARLFNELAIPTPKKGCEGWDATQIRRIKERVSRLDEKTPDNPTILKNLIRARGENSESN